MLATAVLVEGGIRTWLWAGGNPFSSADAAEEVHSILQGMLGLAAGIELEASPAPADGEPARQRRGPRYKLHPYTGFNHNQGLANNEEAIKYFNAGQPAGEYSVFFLGGSVAAGFQAGAESNMQELFSEGLGLGKRRLRLFGLAVPGHKQPQQLLALTYLVSQGCRPDLVINLDGLNELRISQTNARAGIDPSFPSVGHWASLLGAGTEDHNPELTYARLRPQQEAAQLGAAALENGSLKSAALSLLTLSRLRALQVEWAAAQAASTGAQAVAQQTAEAAGFGTETRKSRALEQAVDCWFNSSLAMHGLCESLGIRYMHWLQPTLHDLGSKPVHPVEQRVGIGAGGLNPAVVSGYPLLRKRLADLQQLGVEALNTSDAFIQEEDRIYRDSCHLTSRGNRLLLERVVALVAER
jgi:hypothetical protein